MIDLLRSIPEKLVSSTYRDSDQPKGRQHFYARVWEFVAKGTIDVCMWPLKRPVTIGGVAAGVIAGKDNLGSAVFGGIAGGVIGELFEQIYSSKL